MDDLKSCLKGGRQAEMENMLHVFTLQYWIDFCASTKKNPIQSEHLMIPKKVWKETAQLRLFASLMQRIVSEVKPIISIVAVSKSSKLEPFSVLDIKSVLNLMQFLHTHRNMHCVFL